MTIKQKLEFWIVAKQSFGYIAGTISFRNKLGVGSVKRFAYNYKSTNKECLASNEFNVPRRDIATMIDQITM